MLSSHSIRIDRYVTNFHKSQPKLTGPLTAEEYRATQTRWIQKNCQAHVYQKELAGAKPKPGHSTANTPPLVRQLRLFLARLDLCVVVEESTMYPSVNWLSFTPTKQSPN